ncbi:MAG: alpha-L-glutamate ligase-like protein [Desulfomonile sp.]|nr:alpha-L-glutamate ligase-like protein [Desulfomonile sp.]
MLSLISALRRKGVLCINKRNRDYILRYNPRRFYPLVDDKLRTKQLAQENNIAVPDLYGVIEVEGQVRTLKKILRDRPGFVVKPAHGSGGEGILVIDDCVNGKFRQPDGSIIDEDELQHHVFSILSGLYSLGGQPDKAFIEYRVVFDPTFEHISYLGVPDIRIVVFLGVPVMSMVRLPTRISEGKANLHKGAVGVGVDIATGRTLAGVLGNSTITEHPDTAQPVTGVAVPGWDDLLQLACRCHAITSLGYLGVDIVLDRTKGPLILELNARPGLNIQIANNDGLLPRLELVEHEHAKLQTVVERVAFARENFAVESRARKTAAAIRRKPQLSL